MPFSPLPQRIGGRVTEIQRVTGAYQLGGSPHSGQATTVLGHPSGTDKAITCRTTVYFTRGFPSFNCRGFVGGTSGGPWLVQTTRGTRIVGVIGGMNQGGCIASTSYSSRLTQATRKAKSLADDQATSEIAPRPGSDGC